MKPKIGVFCEPDISDEELLSELLSSGQFDPVCFDSAEELMRDYRRGNTRGIVFGLHSVCRERADVIERIVQSVNGTPMTVLCKKLNEKQRMAISELGNIFALKNPSEVGDLTGVFRKMFAAQPVLTRLGERQRVNLRVEFMKDDQEGSCVLTDISRCGASGTVFSGALQRGDFVKIHVPVLKHLKEKWVAAEVVWEQSVNAQNGIHSGARKKIGLSFAV